MNTPTERVIDSLAYPPNDAPVKHYNRGPSKAPRILQCVGCVAEEAKWPSEPSGAAAIDGTHSHTLLETCMRRQLRSADEYLGETITDHDGTFFVEQDRIDRVNLALAYIWGRFDFYTVNALTHSPPDIYAEHFVDAGLNVDIPGWKGTSDIVMRQTNMPTGIEGRTMTVLEVIDYKDGFVVVQSTSPQLSSYAQGAINSWPLANFDMIRCTIIQPKDELEPIKHVEYTWREFEGIVMPPIVSAMRLSILPDAQRTPGPHCKYCSGAHPGRCKEFNRQILDTATLAFANTPVFSESQTPAAAGGQDVAPPLSIPEITDENYTNEQIAMAQEVAPFVRTWLDELTAEGIRRAQAGQTIPRHKVVRGRANRKWGIDDQEELKRKIRNTGLKKAEWIKETVRTPTQVLDAKGVKDWSDAKVKNLQKLIVKPDGALKLVSENDSGRAVIFNAEVAFKDVPALPEPNPNKSDNNEPTEVEPPYSFL